VKVPDNVGKGTQIQFIKNWLEEFTCEPVHVLHYSNIKGIKEPDPKVLTSKIKLMSVRLYDQMFNIMKNAVDYGVNVIADRSHIGESVYGSIFRNYSGDFVFTIEMNYCNEFKGLDEKDLPIFSTTKLWNNTKLITFIDEPQNLINREDGQSFSTDLETKIQEIEGFKIAYNKSVLCKKLINISGLNAEEVWFSQVLPFLEEPIILTPERQRLFE
jgi:hypothetical protein